MAIEFKSLCPFCGFQNDRVTSVLGDTDMPEDGMVSFCFACGEFSFFDSSRSNGLRPPTPDEKAEIKWDEDFQKIHAAWTFVMRDNRKDH